MKSIKTENKFLKNENEGLKKIIDAQEEMISELNKKIGGLKMTIEFKNDDFDTLNNTVLSLKKVALK